MKRRTCLFCCLTAPMLAAADQNRKAGIQLHVDLTVDPARESEMLQKFREVFRPAASKQPGYIDVQLFKLRSALMGNAPADANYRFVLTFESEELRQKWVASDVHQKVWPAIENCLKHRNYNVLLYDIS